MSIDFKQARLTLGLNQAQMAQTMGIHRQTWVKWERNERKPNATAVRLIELLLWLHKKNLLNLFFNGEKDNDNNL
jgi:DNA-binding XRE family transcriptional regulator